MKKNKPLYPFQAEGVRWLVENELANLYLADEMGLGKTVQACVAARVLGVKHPIVVCPANAVPNWRKEWREWCPGVPLAVISYSRLLRHWRRVTGAGWDLVILDEAHYVKTPSAKRSRRALKLAGEAENAWLLSGTPMPNHPGELWSPVKKLWPYFPERFGITRSSQWLDAFTKSTPTLYGPRPYAVKNAPTLKEFLSEIMLRRTWSEAGLDLPPLRVDVSYLNYDEKFRDQLEAMLAEGGVDYVLEAQSDDPHVSRLRRFLGEYKVGKVAEVLREELAEKAYSKIVVLAYHKDVIARLQKALDKFGVVTLDGSTPPGKRAWVVEEFQTNDACRVFIGQQRAAGVALNLQVAHELVLLEPAWSPSDNAQAIKRVHRIGQEHPCRARIFAVPETLDDRIMDVLAEKLRMQTEVGLS